MGRGLRLSRPLIAATLLTLGWGRPATAQAPSPAEFERLKNDVARLEQELRQQKQLILQLMQGEQQRYDMIMQILRSGPRSSGETALPPPPTLPAPAAAGAPASPASAPSTPEPPAARAATVSGKVQLPSGVTEAYVYVEGLRGGSGRGKQVEIKQQGKQFVPQVAVVLPGTKVTFPNYDSVAHNAFSRSSGNAFDLGGIKAGEKSGQVVMSRPGHVEIFCNIHAKMRADVLVVPSSHYARVRPDGSFQISGVPVGSRTLVLWSPAVKPQSQAVQVTPGGATVSFSPQMSGRKQHLNKFGNSYGSYNE